MKTEIIRETNSQGGPPFDYTKTWYLTDNFFEALEEGMVLQDKSAFKNSKESKSKIRITDFSGVCRELSGPFIYPVRVKAETRVKKAAKGSWFAEAVQLTKPLLIGDFLNTMFDKIHHGTIDFTGQPSLPEKLRLPDVVCGDLIFSGNLLPYQLQLPQRIEGELKIQLCKIPETWELPREANKISLIDCLFHGNINFIKAITPEIFIKGCQYQREGFFPNEYPGGIELASDTFSPEFTLPDTVGTLTLTDMRFEKGTTFPEIISGKLILKHIQDFTNLTLPPLCHTFWFSDCKLPKKILASYSNLKELLFFRCELPDDFVIPHHSLTRLSFKSMKVPFGLNLPDDYAGKLEFRNARTQAGLRLPDNLNNKIIITEPDLRDPSQDHTNDDYCYILNTY
jgi:hypothetical protein